MWRSWVFLVVSLGTLGASRTACAQPVAEPSAAAGPGLARWDAAPALGYVPVTLVASDPRLSFRLRSKNDPGRGVSCQSRCTLELRRGKYRLYLTDASGHESSRALSFDEPARLTLTPPNSSALHVGAGLAVGGLVVASVGFALAAYVLGKEIDHALGCAENCAISDESARSDRRVFTIGMIGTASGAAVGLVGGVLVLSNLRPSVSAEQHPAARGSVALGLGLGGLRLRVAF